MPELPDITVYIDAIQSRILNETIMGIRVATPFLLRTFDPPVSEFIGKKVSKVFRIGKRIAFEFEDDLYLILHLMIAGRLHWRDANAKIGGKMNLASFDFPNGSLVLTEAGTKRRASLHLVRGRNALDQLDPGGIDVLNCSQQTFAEALRSENHTLKRSLTDPRLFSGIGNAYSDEILFAASLSPMKLTQKMSDDEVSRLFTATIGTLNEWTVRLLKSANNGFPEKVTAFQPDMAIHGRFGLPCRRCGSPIQRIRYADNETNYCAVCQTDGKLLSDRAFSRLLGPDWPKTLDAMELLTAKHRSNS